MQFGITFQFNYNFYNANNKNATATIELSLLQIQRYFISNYMLDDIQGQRLC